MLKLINNKSIILGFFIVVMSTACARVTPCNCARYMINNDRENISKCNDHIDSLSLSEQREFNRKIVECTARL